MRIIHSDKNKEKNFLLTSVEKIKLNLYDPNFAMLLSKNKYGGNKC